MSQRKKIGRYFLKDLLGEGAMGSVFQAHDPNLERDVAIKTMRTGKLKKKNEYSEFKKRFFLEAKANGRLNHPNIVSVYDSGVEDDEPYLVMEFIQGKALDTYVEEDFDNRLDFYIPLLEQMALGLDYAHEEGVIHRDVKPGNILVSRYRSHKVKVKIVDFGLAKLKDSKLTATGYFLGTPSYSSPEQVMGGKLDIGSDLFSFGTVAYEMLTGVLPFDGQSLHAILYKIANEQPTINLDPFADYLDVHALAGVFQTIFEKKPEKRYPSAVEFIHDLKSLTAPLKKVVLPREAFEQRRLATSKLVTVDSNQPADNGSDQAEAVVDTVIKRVEKARLQFRQALETKNLSSSRYCLQELISLGVDVKAEQALLTELENELKGQEKERSKKQVTKLVRKARADFKMALKTRNLESVRYCLKELKRLSKNVKLEQASLERLEQEIAAEKERAEREGSLREHLQASFKSGDLTAAREHLEALKSIKADVSIESHTLEEMERKEALANAQRESYILRTRQQFQEACEKGSLEKAGKYVTELESLLKVDATSEREAYTRMVEEQQREEAIKTARKAFNQGLSQEKLKVCQTQLKALEELKAEVAKEQKALKMLEDRLKREESERLKKRMIRHLRDQFRETLANRNLEGCRYYLKELRQLVPDVTSEDRALGSLQAMIAEQESNNLKESIITKLREQFTIALNKPNLESCRYYLHELSLLEVDISFEEAGLAKLEQKQAAETELTEKMIEQAREKLHDALDKKDLTQGIQYFNVLKELGGDVTDERKILMRLKKESSFSHEEGQKVRAKMIQQFRNSFAEAHAAGNADTCRHYLDELAQLDVETGEERKKLATLLPTEP